MRQSPLDKYRDVNSFLTYTRIAWYAQMAVIALPVLYMVCIYKAETFTRADKNSTKCLFILAPIMLIVQAVAVGLEYLLQAKITDSGYYKGNIFSHFETLDRYKGCSGPAFDIALSQVLTPIEHERPSL